MELLILAGLMTAGLLVSVFKDDNDPEPAEDSFTDGTEGDDSLVGGGGDDLLMGQDGDDTLDGAGDDDAVLGEGGNDLLRGSGGDDSLAGGTGDDRLNGWSGDDLLIGGAGNDQLAGGQDDDSLFGGTGGDTLEGGAGNDLLDGREALTAADYPADLLAEFNDSMADLLPNPAPADLTQRLEDVLDPQGEPAPDLLRGGAGDDTLIGDSGDTLNGGSGEDSFVVSYDGAEDFAAAVLRDFQPGSELLDIRLGDAVVGGDLTFAADGPDTVISLNGVQLAIVSNATPEDLAGAGITLTGGLPPVPGGMIDTGTTGDDATTGAGTGDVLLGDAGNDTIDGAAGDDLVAGEAGDDLLRGSAGQDTLIGGDGDDRLTGWTADDLLVGGAGDDDLNGGEGEDTLLGGTGRDLLEGGAGDDVLDGRDPAADTGLSDEQLAEIDAALAVNTGGVVDPALQERLTTALADAGEAGADLLRGGDGDDLLIGDSGDTMTGGAGTDSYVVDFDGAQDWTRTVIRDFDPASERLDILLDDDVAQGELAFAERGMDTVVSLNGVALVIISNTTPTQLATANIVLSGGQAAA